MIYQNLPSKIHQMLKKKIEKVNMTTKNIDSKISPKQEKKSPNNSKFR